MMFEEGEYYSPSEVFSCINSLPSSKKKKKMINKRRFSDEQVKSLESIFENETKLEPKKKVQLARELGLQPRQIAIWFQNKRARYKSKQLERDYSILRSNYNALASQFDSLKKEKQALTLQLQKLKDLAEKGDPTTENKCYNNNESAANSNTDSQSDNEKSDSEKSESENTNNNNNDQYCEVKPTLSLEGSEYGASMLSDEGSSENTNYFGVEGETDIDMDMDILKMVEPVGAASLTSPEAEASWDELRTDGLFGQAVDSCQWLDFWS